MAPWNIRFCLAVPAALDRIFGIALYQEGAEEELSD
jgi:hypothetical protein